MFGDAGFQGFGQGLADRVIVGLDLVADDGADGVDMGIDQHDGRGHALFRGVHQLAQRTGEAGHQRVLIGGAEPLEVVGAEVEGLGRFGIVALVADIGLGLVELFDFVLQPLGELGGHGLQGLLRLGDGLGVNAAESTTDLQAKGVGGTNDLCRTAHRLLL